MKWMGALEFRTSLWFRLEPVPTGKELDVGQEKKGEIVRLKGFGSQTLVKWIIWTGIL